MPRARFTREVQGKRNDRVLRRVSVLACFAVGSDAFGADDNGHTMITDLYFCRSRINLIVRSAGAPNWTGERVNLSVNY